MKYTLLLLFIFPLLATNCEDDPPLSPLEQLPPATQTGEYTFGCLVNGEAFVSDNRGDITAIYQQNVLLISSDYKRQGIGFVFRNQVIEERTYTLARNNERGAGFIDSSNLRLDSSRTNYIGNCEYEYEDLAEGTLTITRFDSINFIVAGTFEFTTATEGCDTIRVTNGRFDIPYIP